MNILFRLILIVLLTVSAVLPLMLSASPPLAPHLHTPFSSTGSRKYYARLPWAVKAEPKIDWLEELGNTQETRKKFLLKGYKSPEIFKRYQEDLKERCRKNSNLVEELIENRNRHVPLWVNKKYQ